MREARSRTVLTSGGLEPVADGGKDYHSAFANPFLTELREMDDILTGEELFFRMKNKIVLNSDQTPMYEELQDVGSEGGDFIFVRAE